MQQNQAVQDRAAVLSALSSEKLSGHAPISEIKFDSPNQVERQKAVLDWLKQSGLASVGELEVILTSKGQRIGAQLNAGFKRLAD